MLYWRGIKISTAKSKKKATPSKSKSAVKAKDTKNTQIVQNEQSEKKSVSKVAQKSGSEESVKDDLIPRLADGSIDYKRCTKAQIDKLYKYSLWYKGLRDTTNLSFLPLYVDKSRYLVLCGGGGSGKSIFAGRKILERVTSESGHRILVCRKVGKTIRESCYRQLISQLQEHYPDVKYTANQTDMSISLPNGSVIITSGLDDVEKLKSIHGITGIWIEEASEITEQDFNQLDIRLRGTTPYYKQIIISFNPVSILSWLKLRFFDSTPDNCTTHRSTYKDNRFLDEDAIRVLESFKETDEYYYTVYCLGEWGVTGKTVFNAQAVTQRLLERVQPIKTGYFNANGDFIEDKQSAIVKIYTDVIDGVPYVIGGDTAGDGSDSFVGQVIDNRDGRQVAVLRHRFDEDTYAYQMYCLGLYYNQALIAIEANYSTYPILELERLGYPKQYVRESIDDYTHRIKQSYGFRTTAQTRPVIISNLVSALRDDISLISDETTLNEMLTFVRNEDFRPEAEQGAHDDCIMALAIAHHARGQQTKNKHSAENKPVKWREDQWEDYYGADKAGKAYLISIWGTPKR